jgi:hypothetical protein
VFDFKATLDSIADMHLMACPHIQQGILRVWGIFQDSITMTFLTDGFEETVELDQFITRQYSHLDEATKSFKGSIQETLDRVISTTVTESMVSIKPKERQQHQNMISLATIWPSHSVGNGQ